MKDIHSNCKDYINSGKICYSCGRELCGNNKCKKEDKQRCAFSKTLEHIPPLSLFEQNKGFSNVNANPEINKITVPCCTECNNKYSKDDEIFVAFITMIASRTSKVANYAYKKNRVRGIRKNGKLLQEIRNSMKQLVNMKTNAGIYLGKVLMLDISIENRRSIFNVLKKIVKGYCYKKTKKFLNKEIKYYWDNMFFKQNTTTGEYRNNNISEAVKTVIDGIGSGNMTKREGNSFINVYNEDIKKGVFSYSFCDFSIDDINKGIIFAMTFYDSQKFIFYAD